jgi:hypothetical protein
MLEELLDQKVVIDLVGPYVCMGTLVRIGDHFVEVKNADLHDLRDTDSTREFYVLQSVQTGVKRNRRQVLVARAEIVAVSRLDDVVDE